MNQVYLPRILNQEFSIQHVGEETLVYDERRHLAFCLNRVSSAVWTHCDGTHSVPQIAAALQTEFAQPVSHEMVDLALEQMQQNGLLEPNPHTDAVLTTPTAISRRSMMSKAGAGALVMVPMIAAIMAPKAAQAYSGGVHSFKMSGDDNKKSAPKVARNADAKGDLGADHQQALLAEEARQSHRAGKEIKQ